MHIYLRRLRARENISFVQKYMQHYKLTVVSNARAPDAWKERVAAIVVERPLLSAPLSPVAHGIWHLKSRS